MEIPSNYADLKNCATKMEKVEEKRFDKRCAIFAVLAVMCIVFVGCLVGIWDNSVDFNCNFFAIFRKVKINET